MPRMASPLSSSFIGNLTWSYILFTTWYVFCLERHFLLLVFSCCYSETCFLSFISIKMSSIAFTMLILQVYMLLFENRKFVVMFWIFVNSQNMINLKKITQWVTTIFLQCGNFSEFLELGKYDSSCILYGLFCLDRLQLCLHCLHMFACLMILFKDKSIKYVEAVSMQCLIIILVICYNRKW